MRNINNGKNRSIQPRKYQNSWRERNYKVDTIKQAEMKDKIRKKNLSKTKKKRKKDYWKPKSATGI